MKPALLSSICLAVSETQKLSSPRQRLAARGQTPPQISHRMSSMSRNMKPSMSSCVNPKVFSSSFPKRLAAIMVPYTPLVRPKSTR